MAIGLNQDEVYCRGLADDPQEKRARIASGLTSTGFDTMPTDGTYFISVAIRSVGFEGDWVAFRRMLTRDIALSAIYQDTDVNHFLRLYFSTQYDISVAMAAKLTAFPQANKFLYFERLKLNEWCR